MNFLRASRGGFSTHVGASKFTRSWGRFKDVLFPSKNHFLSYTFHVCIQTSTLGGKSTLYDKDTARKNVHRFLHFAIFPLQTPGIFIWDLFYAWGKNNSTSKTATTNIPYMDPMGTVDGKTQAITTCHDSKNRIVSSRKKLPTLNWFFSLENLNHQQ